MMQLSRYVIDPLTTPSPGADFWYHPITHAKVRLSPALKAKLPDLLLVDLDREACGPDEVLCQLLAAELRDLGFLIPTQWANKEEECLALHRPPQHNVPGFLGLQPRNLTDLSADTKCVFLSVGTDSGHFTSHDSLAYLRESTGSLLNQRHLVDLNRRRLIPHDTIHGQTGDLGHLCTRGLSSAQIGQKIQLLLPSLPSGTLPILVMDHVYCLVDMVHEESLWPRLDSDLPGPIRPVIFDQEARFGEGIPREVERFREDSPETLFAKLEWAKKSPDLRYMYIGLPAEFTTRGCPQVTSEILTNNDWVSCSELFDKQIFSPHPNGISLANKTPLESPQTNILVIHSSVFAHSASPSLAGRLNQDIAYWQKTRGLRGVIFWGFDHTITKQLDLGAFHRTLLSLVNGACV